jgi:hypothetical protein
MARVEGLRDLHAREAVLGSAAQRLAIVGAQPHTVVKDGESLFVA